MVEPQRLRRHFERDIESVARRDVKGVGVAVGIVREDTEHIPNVAVLETAPQRGKVGVASAVARVEVLTVEPNLEKLVEGRKVGEPE